MSDLLLFLVSLAGVVRAANKAGINVSDLVHVKMKEYVDRLHVAATTFRTSRGIDTPVMTVREIETARYTGKLDSIKQYKDRTGCSLMDSKMSVEEQMARFGYEFFR